jgi:CO/xanthine dehydrogenase Mo-binding subunit
VPEDAYQIPNRRMSWSTVSPFLAKANPLRGSHLRDPCGPQLHFASESFWDEVAFATGQDPVAMRLRHLTTPRDIAVIKAVADKAGWKPGPPGSRRERRGDVLIGRGLAYGHAHGTLVAIIAEVEVTPSTGRIWPRRFFVAHDCGRIVNPKGIHTVIEGCVVQGASRALFEETTFNRRAVTSVDWISYPILGMADAPESIDIVLLDHPELDPSGAGEPATRFTPAALANAVFDATGVRMRRAPLTPARIKAALA